MAKLRHRFRRSQIKRASSRSRRQSSERLSAAQHLSAQRDRLSELLQASHAARDARARSSRRKWPSLRSFIHPDALQALTSYRILARPLTLPLPRPFDPASFAQELRLFYITRIGAAYIWRNDHQRVVTYSKGDGYAKPWIGPSKRKVPFQRALPSGMRKELVVVDGELVEVSSGKSSKGSETTQLASTVSSEVIDAASSGEDNSSTSVASDSKASEQSFSQVPMREYVDFEPVRYSDLKVEGHKFLRDWSEDEETEEDLARWAKNATQQYNPVAELLEAAAASRGCSTAGQDADLVVPAGANATGPISSKCLEAIEEEVDCEVEASKLNDVEEDDVRRMPRYNRRRVVAYNSLPMIPEDNAACEEESEDEQRSKGLQKQDLRASFTPTGLGRCVPHDPSRTDDQLNDAHGGQEDHLNEHESGDSVNKIASYGIVQRGGHDDYDSESHLFYSEPSANCPSTREPAHEAVVDDLSTVESHHSEYCTVLIPEPQHGSLQSHRQMSRDMVSTSELVGSSIDDIFAPLATPLQPIDLLSLDCKAVGVEKTPSKASMWSRMKEAISSATAGLSVGRIGTKRPVKRGWDIMQKLGR